MKSKYLNTSLAFLFLLAGLWPLHAQSSMQVGDTLELYLDTPYTGNLQWQESQDGVAWTDIAAATTNPYRMEITSLSVYYRARITADGCDVFYSEVFEPENPEGFTIMSNGDDPLIALYTRGDGTRIDYYGTRDEQGNPVQIDRLVVNAPGDTTWYQLDELSRPTAILGQNGVKLEFEWVEGQVAVVTAISADGQEQISTEVDFVAGEVKSAGVTRQEAGGEPDQEADQEQVRIRVLGKELRGGQSVKLDYQELTGSVNETIGDARLKSTTAASGNAVVHVIGCGTQDRVMVTVNTTSGKLLGVFPTTYLGEGMYSASLPTNLAPKLNPSESCSSVASALGYACMINEVPGLPVYLCTALSAAMFSSPITAPFAASVATACASATAGMEIYCNTLNASPAPGAPSLADKICKSDFLDREFTEDVVIQAYVVGLVNNRYSEKKTVPGNGPFEDLYITMDAETKIQSLTLDPASPAYEESYSAICKISCLQAGSQVTLSVSGSDGYTDSASYTIASGQQEGEFTLQVPGAETGVRDVVTVTVTLLSGETLSRSASLVFN